MTFNSMLKEHIGSGKELKNVPVILFTGYDPKLASDEEISFLLISGTDEVAFKLFYMEYLLQRVESLLL